MLRRHHRDHWPRLSPATSKIARRSGSKMKRMRSSVAPTDPGRSSFKFLWRDPFIESTSRRVDEWTTDRRTLPLENVQCGNDLLHGNLIEALDPRFDKSSIEIPILQIRTTCELYNTR